MGSDGLAVGASEADIDQGVGVQEMLERGQGIETVVIPLEMELLSLHDFCFDFLYIQKRMRGKNTSFFKNISFNNLFVSSDDIFLLFLRGSQQHVKKEANVRTVLFVRRFVANCVV